MQGTDGQLNRRDLTTLSHKDNTPCIAVNTTEYKSLIEKDILFIHQQPNLTPVPKPNQTKPHFPTPPTKNTQEDKRKRKEMKRKEKVHESNTNTTEAHAII